MNLLALPLLIDVKLYCTISESENTRPTMILIQCGLGRGLLPYEVASSSIQPFDHNRHGPKIGWGGCALF